MSGRPVLNREMATLKLAADLAQLAAIRAFVAQAGRELDLDGRAVEDIQLAADEACTNAIRHAYGGKGGLIEVTVELAGGEVRLIVRDWGKRFDPAAVPVPAVDAPLERRPPGGMGLYLIRQSMDRVEFHFDELEGNTITMIKQRERGTDGI